jgi:maleate isomerase
METVPYNLVGAIGTNGILGLVVLSTDEVLECEFKRIFSSDATAVYTTRIRMASEVTGDTLQAMAADIPAAASMLPAALQFDAIGYCCTSASARIGPDNVSRLVQEGANTRHVTNPFTAVTAALSALKVQNVAILAPYIPAVVTVIAESIAAHGFTVQNLATFNEVLDANVARINPQSILDAVLKMGKDPKVDAVFISCTNLRTVDIVALAEAALGKPVISSNLSLAWHMNELAGGKPIGPSFGSLMTRRLDAPVV